MGFHGPVSYATGPVSYATGVVLPPTLTGPAVPEYARRAERLGFASLWVVEDCFLGGGVAQAATALAVTERITVGLGLLPVGARNPAFAAMELATLAQLHPGRLLAGVGHGMPEWMRQVGAWEPGPLARLEEYVRALRALLAGERVTVDGRHVRLDGARLAAPPDPPPPVLAGVRGPRSLELSGRVAEGTILAEPVTPEYLAAARARIAAAAPPGAGHLLVCYNLAAVADDPAAARAAVRPDLARVGDPAWRAHLDPLPFRDELLALRAAAASDAEFVARLPDAWVDELAVVGTPRDARARLDALAAAGADHLVLAPVGADPLAALTDLGRLR